MRNFNNDVTEEIGELLFNNNKYMGNLFEITKEDVRGALVSATFMAVTAILVYVYEQGSIWALDFAELVNVGVMAAIVYLISIAKNFLTDSDGKFVGAVKIK